MAIPWASFFAVFDAPLPALAIPGFVGGVIFSIVLLVAGPRRSFHALSLPRFAAWGALGGLLLSLIPAAMVTAGLATVSPGSELTLWSLTAVIAGPLIALSAASAAGSLMLARRRGLTAGGELARQVSSAAFWGACSSRTTGAVERRLTNGRTVTGARSPGLYSGW